MNQQPEAILKASCRYKVGLLGDIILRNASFFPERVAFIYGEQRITFGQYNRRVNSLIHALNDLGIKKGEVLGILSWNCIEYTFPFGAAEKGGFIVAPFNVRLSEKEIDYLINDSEATVLFVGAEFGDLVDTLRPRFRRVKHFISFEGPLPGMESLADLLKRYPTNEPDVQVDDDDPLFICYTSGTTGQPRGALYTHLAHRENVICHALEVPIGHEDRGISLMPLFHIGGIAILSYLFHQGVTAVIDKFFDPKATMELIEKERITNIIVVPTHLTAMLDHPDFSKYDLSSLRRIYYAGSPMPTELLRRGMKAFGSVFFQGYGQTESGPEIAYLKEKDHEVLGDPQKEKRLLSCGYPVVGVHVRIVDGEGSDVPPGEVGEIIVKSRHIMLEYWKKPQETQETILNGWLHTGDLGYYDEDGYIYIVDRKQDMIISGGENIYPREVEEVLYKHPAVSECAVFGIPDPKWVEAVHGVVSLREGAAATPEELIEFCKKNMARYKSPKSVEIVNEIPKSGTGKIMKKEMRKKYWR